MGRRYKDLLRFRFADVLPFTENSKYYLTPPSSPVRTSVESNGIYDALPVPAGQSLTLTLHTTSAEKSR